MRECICCQCSEGDNDFKGYLQCLHCNDYGSEDEFYLDEHKELCDDCIKKLEKKL